MNSNAIAIFQHMLEKAEQRSRALGISNSSKFPLSECSVPSASSASDAVVPQRSRSPGSVSTSSKVVVLDKASLEASPTKPLRHYTAVNKENMEMGIEINITTDKPIGVSLAHPPLSSAPLVVCFCLSAGIFQVQVEIQEEEVTDDDEAAAVTDKQPALPVNQPLARLRDTSRSRLQRMGALYSNTDDLSSPIHRTEGQFHADDDNDNASRPSRQPKQRFGKLAALADTINQWEDDTAHHEVHRPIEPPPPKPDLPSRRIEKAPAPQPPQKKDEVDDAAKTKQLKWDPKVLSSLEAQGFQRRESSTIKHTYDYAKQGEVAPAAKPPVPEKSTSVSQVAKAFASSAATKPAPAAPASTVGVKSGLVSGRAAIFENKGGAGGQMQGSQRNQKDPCELSLKERMKLFETGNNKAIVPIAPIGSAPSISQIRPEEAKRKFIEDFR